MNVAAFETSSRVGSVALLKNSTLFESRLEQQRRHASDLLPALEGLLREAKLNAQDLDAVAVGIGPGSYTGLRVGIATALGLSLAVGAKLRAVPSFESLAFERGGTGEEYCIAMDARAKGWYFARYRCETDCVQVIDAPSVLSAPELLARLKLAQDGSIDPGVRKLLQASELEADRYSDHITPSAGNIARLGQRGLALFGPHEPFECEPLYLRPFAVKPRRR